MVQPRSLNIRCFLGHFLLLINPGLVVQAINLPLQSAPFTFSSGLVKITGAECLKSRLLHFLQFWLITSILFLSGKLLETHGQTGLFGNLKGEKNGGKGIQRICQNDLSLTKCSHVCTIPCMHVAHTVHLHAHSLAFCAFTHILPCQHPTSTLTEAQPCTDKSCICSHHPRPPHPPPDSWQGTTQMVPILPVAKQGCYPNLVLAIPAWCSLAFHPPQRQKYLLSHVFTQLCS